MTKKHVSMGILALLLVWGMSLSGCKTIDSVSGGAEIPRGTFETITVPAKDFQALGLVFAEASYDKDENGSRGDILTFQSLLLEAKKLGADYIVNVVIDYKNEGSQKYFFGNPRDVIKGKVTWYGSATAIKYTNTIKGISVIYDSEGKVVNSTEYNILNRNPDNSNSGSGDGYKGGLFSRLFKKNK